MNGQAAEGIGNRIVINSVLKCGEYRKSYCESKTYTDGCEESFHKSEVWIEEEKMYEVLYEVTLDLQYEDEEIGSVEPESED